MKLNLKILLIAVIIFFTACESANLVPAVRPASQNGDEISRNLIEQAIADLLNDNIVTISDNAFIENSEIIIERRNLNNDEGDRIMGRKLDSPDHFKLWKKADICLIEHVETQEYAELPSLICIEIGE